ncbi:hypothetical protein CI15_20780 [Paraburkholderia monticola]|uniref:Uncharacterized protein n=1 Tax=Paraburkholderia monticola TaxID=1399968 RepID=A0A149PKN5_9BURK|nr:hypothetical protein [Paraburkholderia monticola]KXU85613.1 hypothetical protein CI15_20780 [Paraburkholderia monticola]
MFDLDVALLSPDQQVISLRDIAGTAGLVIAGLGRGAERGFQMAHRFHDAGDQLATAGVNLAFVYPHDSRRHVLDPISVACARLRRHPYLLLDPEGRFFRRTVPPRSLSALSVSRRMERFDCLSADLNDAAWERTFRAFLVARIPGGLHELR